MAKNDKGTPAGNTMATALAGALATPDAMTPADAAGNAGAKIERMLTEQELLLKIREKVRLGQVSLSVVTDATPRASFGRGPLSMRAVDFSVPITYFGVVLYGAVYAQLEQTSGGNKVDFSVSMPAKAIKFSAIASKDQFHNHVKRAIAAWPEWPKLRKAVIEKLMNPKADTIGATDDPKVDLSMAVTVEQPADDTIDPDKL